MQSKALKLNQDFDNLYNELILEMARRRIFLVNETQLDEIQLKWVKKYFHKEVLPHVTPIMLRDDIDVMQFLKDEYAYIAVEMRSGDEFKYALIEIPTDQLPRFVMLPEQKANGAKPLFCSITLFVSVWMRFSAVLRLRYTQRLRDENDPRCRV